ncbi:hypothetical protein BC829DRAFT_401193 [Chytridium lagenaria]|nr:hypothetical protein BC829DRAFT_401193 [Chytridium lagenaria]
MSILQYSYPTREGFRAPDPVAWAFIDAVLIIPRMDAADHVENLVFLNKDLKLDDFEDDITDSPLPQAGALLSDSKDGQSSVLSPLLKILDERRDFKQRLQNERRTWRRRLRQHGHRSVPLTRCPDLRQNNFSALEWAYRQPHDLCYRAIQLRFVADPSMVPECSPNTTKVMFHRDLLAAYFPHSTQPTRDVLKKFLDSPPNVNYKTFGPYQCISIAILRDDISIAQTMFKDPAYITPTDTQSMIVHAARLPHANALVFLKDTIGIDITFNDNLALVTAISSGFTEPIRYLLGCSGVNPNARNGQAFLAVVKTGDLNAVKALVRMMGSRLDVSANDFAVVRWVCGGGRLRVEVDCEMIRLVMNCLREWKERNFSASMLKEMETVWESLGEDLFILASSLGRHETLKIVQEYFNVRPRASAAMNNQLTILQYLKQITTLGLLKWQQVMDMQ